MRVSFGIGSDLSCLIVDKMFRTNFSSLVLQNSGDIVSAISFKVNIVIGSLIIPTVRIFVSILMLFMLLFVMYLISSQTIAYIIFFGLIIYVLMVIIFKPKLRKISNEISLNSNLVIRNLQESFSSIRDIIMHNHREFYLEKYEKSDRRFRESIANNQIIGGMPKIIIEGLLLLFVAVFAYYQTYQGKDIYIYIPIIGTMVVAAQKTLPLFQQLYLSWSQLAGGEESIRDVSNFLKDHKNKFLVNGNCKSSRFDKLTLSNIHYSYIGSKTKSLDGISIEINKNDFVAISGPTGSGKSTLVDIIMGLIIPDEGELKLNNIKLSEENISCIRGMVAHVPQSINLLDATIIENIAFGHAKEDISLERVKFCIKIACLEDFVMKLSEGLETRVGERGALLSGGQIQRIGIARALYADRDILVLDEATSALDQQTEKRLLDSLESLPDKKTIIAITHGGNIIQYANKKLEMHEGAIKSFHNV